MRFSDCHPDRKYHALGFCELCYKRDHRNRPKSKNTSKAYWSSSYYKEKRKSWAKGNRRAVNLKYNCKQVGITPDQYYSIGESQGWKCSICDTPIIPSDQNEHGRKHGSVARIDHCHSSGKIRGMLCHKCNVGLGLFNDSVINLRRADKYLSTDTAMADGSEDYFNLAE